MAIVLVPYGLVVVIAIFYWDKLNNIIRAQAKKFIGRMKLFTKR